MNASNTRPGVRSRSTLVCRALTPVLLLGAALLVAACGGGRFTASPVPRKLSRAISPAPLRTPGARVRILVPAADQTLAGSFAAKVAVSGFALTMPTPGARSAVGHGYLEFSLDGGRYDEPRFSGANGRRALALAVNGYYSPAWRPSIEYRRIPAGRHTLTVELANRDGTPAAARATVSFTVR
jgi:hypothetical protein